MYGFMEESEQQLTQRPERNRTQRESGDYDSNVARQRGATDRRDCMLISSIGKRLLLTVCFL